MSAPIRVVLADDHPLFRTGVKTLLDRAPDIEVVGEAGTGTEALALVRQLDPDVVLLDMEMPGMSGIEVARSLLAAGARGRILVLSAYDDEHYVSELLAAGVAGYLLKDEIPERIVAAVRGIARGQGEWVSPGVARIRQAPEAAVPLSAREREVLRLIAEGLDNPAIAERLFISENTVKNHITNIYGKLSLRTRAEAVAWAWRNRVVGSGEP